MYNQTTVLLGSESQRTSNPSVMPLKRSNAPIACSVSSINLGAMTIKEASEYPVITSSMNVSVSSVPRSAPLSPSPQPQEATLQHGWGSSVTRQAYSSLSSLAGTENSIQNFQQEMVVSSTMIDSEKDWGFFVDTIDVDHDNGDEMMIW